MPSYLTAIAAWLEHMSSTFETNRRVSLFSFPMSDRVSILSQRSGRCEKATGAIGATSEHRQDNSQHPPQQQASGIRST